MEAANEVRLNVWRQQPAGFFDEAVLDADGTLAPTSGECKEGMDIAYDGTWGYHPLLISLVQTQEPLYLVNRSGNWAYMVMASLAWTLKAWFALLLPETGRWARKYRAEKQTVLRMEFKTFLNAFILLPCQLVRTGRRIVFRLMAWNPWLSVLFRAVDVLRRPLRC